MRLDLAKLAWNEQAIGELRWLQDAMTTASTRRCFPMPARFCRTSAGRPEQRGVQWERGSDGRVGQIGERGQALGVWKVRALPQRLFQRCRFAEWEAAPAV